VVDRYMPERFLDPRLKPARKGRFTAAGSTV